MSFSSSYQAIQFKKLRYEVDNYFWNVLYKNFRYKTHEILYVDELLIGHSSVAEWRAQQGKNYKEGDPKPTIYER